MTADCCYVPSINPFMWTQMLRTLVRNAVRKEGSRDVAAEVTMWVWHGQSCPLLWPTCISSADHNVVLLKGWHCGQQRKCWLVTRGVDIPAHAILTWWPQSQCSHVFLQGFLWAHVHVLGMLWLMPLTLTYWACPLLFILFLRLFLSFWPFQMHFISYILPTTLDFLILFFQSYLCLTGPFNCISFYESLLQPWYNPQWLTGLKTPIN